MTTGPKKKGAELMTKQPFLKCSNSTGCLFVIKLCFKLLIVILVYICWSLKVHSVPERISLQVLQVKHFPCNKDMKGCKLRGNIVMKCKTSMMNDSEGFKGFEIEEDKTIAWKKFAFAHFLHREKSYWWLQLFQALEIITSKLMFSNFLNKNVLKILH